MYLKLDQRIETNDLDREHSCNTTDNSQTECDGDFLLQQTTNFANLVEESSTTKSNKSGEIKNTVDECNEDANVNDSGISDQVQRENENMTQNEITDNVATEESISNITDMDTMTQEHSNITEIKSTDIEDFPSSDNDENVKQMTSAIMESCVRRRVGGSQDMLAFCWLWDFAGQKDFYATHQVFLSTSAIYLLVTDRLEFSTAGELWTDFEKSARKLILIKKHIFLFRILLCFVSLYLLLKFYGKNEVYHQKTLRQKSV